MENDREDFEISARYAHDPRLSAWDALSKWWVGPPIVTFSIFLLIRLGETGGYLLSLTFLDHAVLYIIALVMWMRWASKRETDYLLYWVDLVRHDIGEVHGSHAKL